MSDTSSSPSMPPLIPSTEVPLDLEVDVDGQELTEAQPDSSRAAEEALQLLLRAARLFPSTRVPPQRRAMAIDQVPIPYPETHDLAHTDKGFYGVKIPVSHWQLRHYISTSSEDLYYASGKQVYRLDTRTQQRRHIAKLPFDARCTASGHGWVCVGGEDEGHFAAIQLHGDSSLRAPTVKIERIGEEIVNSISIHRLTDEDAHLDDIVAILTNNDQTVRVYSLPAGQETRVKDLPFAINHATLSPDGRMLVAVGDYNQAYFFTREILEKPPQIPKPHNRLMSKDVDWVLTNVVTLHVSESTVGYFTTAWSPSGGLVAVGSEGGYITVLDRTMLEDPDVEDDDAIVAVVAGSRADIPSPYPGAIRSMVFSPEPWDLLVWAEDQGRVCIGDLRTGLKSRQVICLEPDEEGLRRIDIEDLDANGQDHNEVVMATLDELEEQIMQQYGSPGAQDSAAPISMSSVNLATEYIETRRRQRAARQELAARQEHRDALRGLLDDDLQGLTTREHQILETLRTTRQREEARANGQAPSSVNYTTADLFGTGSRARQASTIPRGPPPFDTARDGDRAVMVRVPSPGGSRMHYVPQDSFGSETPPPRESSSTPSANPPRSINEILSAVQETLPTLSRIHAQSPRPTGSASDNEPPSQDSPSTPSRLASSLSRTTTDGSTSRLPRIRQSVRSIADIAADAASSRSNEGSNRSQDTTAANAANLRALEISNRARLLRARAEARANEAEFEAALSSPSSVLQGRDEEVDDENPWRTIEDHMMNAPTARGPLFESAARARAAPPVPADRNTQEAIEEQRARLQQQVRARERWRTGGNRLQDDRQAREAMALAATLAEAREARAASRANPSAGAASVATLNETYDALFRNSMRGHSGRDVGTRTAGLAISEDGRKLWAACEKGIFEIRVKVRGRMFWPAVDMR